MYIFFVNSSSLDKPLLSLLNPKSMLTSESLAKFKSALVSDYWESSDPRFDVCSDPDPYPDPYPDPGPPFAEGVSLDAILLSLK